MRYILFIFISIPVLSCGYIQSTELQNLSGLSEEEKQIGNTDHNTDPLPENEQIKDDELSDADNSFEDNQYPNIEGVWEMDVESYEKTAGDCHSLIDSGSTFRPFRKFVKIDDTHIEILQCDGEDSVCDNPLYSLGVYTYKNDAISGTGSFVDDSIGTYVKSDVLQNKGTFHSESHVSFINKFHVTFWTDKTLTNPSPNFKTCNHEIIYEMNKR